MVDTNLYLREVIVRGFRRLEGRELDLAYILVKATLEIMLAGENFNLMEKKAIIIMKIINESQNKRLRELKHPSLPNPATESE